MSEQSSGKKTFWKLVKFTIVSLLACIVQFGSLAILYNIPAIKALSTQAFHWFVFDYPVIEGERCRSSHSSSTAKRRSMPTTTSPSR